MKCTIMEQKIAAFVDDSLSVEEEKHLLDHIEGCKFCKNTLEIQQIIYEKYRTMGEDELTAPVDFSVSVIDELDKQGAFAKDRESKTLSRKRESKKTFRSFTKRWFGGAALAAAGLVLVFIGFTGGEIPLIAMDDAMESSEMADDMGVATDDVSVQEVPESERARGEVYNGDSEIADGEPPVAEDSENDFGAMETSEDEVRDISPNYPMILAGLFGILTGGVWLYLRFR